MIEHTTQGSVHVFTCNKPLNHELAPVASTRFAPCIQKGQPRVVLNLEQVPLIDSVGLEMLMTTQMTCARHGGALRLAAPNPLCQQILEVTGVADRIEIYPDMTTAVGSFAQ
jgi:anti-anti-sigma factor